MLVAALLLCCVSLFAQKKPLTPYEYGQRWYFAFQGGPLYFNSDYCNRLAHEGRLLEQFTIGTSVALGYNINNAHAIRFMANYARKTGVCEEFVFYNADPNDDPLPTYTYKFRSVQCFVDYVLNYNALAEYFAPLCAKTYVGLGAAYTFDFTDPKHPEVILSSPNFVPAFNFGFIVEYDFKDSFGLYTDLGLAFYDDHYNGRPYISFPLDMDVSLQIGLIYHFPLKAK